MNGPDKSKRWNESPGSYEANEFALKLKDEPQAQEKRTLLFKWKEREVKLTLHLPGALPCILSHLVFAKTACDGYHLVLSTDEANETRRTEKLLVKCPSWLGRARIQPQVPFTSNPHFVHHNGLPALWSTGHSRPRSSLKTYSGSELEGGRYVNKTNSSTDLLQ